MKRRGAQEEDVRMSPDAARLMMAMGFLQMYNPKSGIDEVIKRVGCLHGNDWLRARFCFYQRW